MVLSKRERNIAIGMGAATQVLTHLPWLLLVGKPGELPRAVLMAAGWLINLGVAEWAIQRGRSRGTRTHAALVVAGAR